MTHRQALEIVYYKTPIEIIISSHETPDFFEFVGECGGDVMKYRVYKSDGKVYEK